jgi:L-amino acid N-acyltransferase
MIIRLAEEKDIEGILEIFNEALVNTTAVYSYKPATYEEQLRWYHHKIEESYPVYVAQIEDQIVGYASYGSFRSRPAYKYTIESSIYVDHKYRNHGYGKQLLLRLIEQAELEGYATMIAGIESSNEPSIGLVKACGFFHVGTIRKAGYKFGRWLDLSFYQLELYGPLNPTED